MGSVGIMDRGGAIAPRMVAAAAPGTEVGGAMGDCTGAIFGPDTGATGPFVPT